MFLILGSVSAYPSIVCLFSCLCHMLWFNRCPVQGGPAKVKPTYIFAGNVWYLNV